jgi:hypothetical protein
LKQDIRPLEGALDMVDRLRGVRFKWRRESSTSSPDQVGVIAQEVAEVLPEAVTTVRGHACVSTHALTPVLIEALKELRQSHAHLSAQVTELRREVAALRQERASAAPERAGKPHEGAQATATDERTPPDHPRGRRRRP